MAMSEAIALAKCMGLIEEVGQVGYRFTHDALWKSFYDMISVPSRSILSLEIGRAMKQRLRSPPGDHDEITVISKTDVDSIFCRTVDQLNKGIQGCKDLMSNEEIVELLLMNIKAAEISALNSSFKSALVYIENITPMLHENEHWESKYDLCLLVNTMHAEINLSLSNFEASISTIDIILRHGKSIDDTYDAYLLLMRSLNSQKKSSEALSVAIDVLDKLGVNASWLTKEASPVKETFRKIIKKLVQQKKICKQLSELAPISNQRKLKVRLPLHVLLSDDHGTL